MDIGCITVCICLYLAYSSFIGTYWWRKRKNFLKGKLTPSKKGTEVSLTSVLKNSYREVLGLPLVEITADTEIFTEMGDVVKQEKLQKKGTCA